MRNLFIIAVLALAFTSCGEPIKTKIPEQSIVLEDLSDEWTDQLIIHYLAYSQNPIIAAARKDSTKMEWMLDRRENSDTAHYLIFQIGHSDEFKFTTDSWLYIDSPSRRIYEYDVAADSLMPVTLNPKL